LQPVTKAFVIITVLDFSAKITCQHRIWRNILISHTGYYPVYTQYFLFHSCVTLTLLVKQNSFCQIPILNLVAIFLNNEFMQTWFVNLISVLTKLFGLCD